MDASVRDDTARVHRFHAPDGTQMRVLRWHGTEALSQGCRWRIELAAPTTAQELSAWLARPAQLLVARSGDAPILHAGLVEGVRCQTTTEGTHYCVDMADWSAWLAHRRHSRTFTSQDLATVIDSVLSAHGPYACWRWQDAARRRADRMHRDCISQYRESDLAFVQRLLARAGLSWFIESTDSAPAGHRMVIVDDSTLLPLIDSAVPYHQARAHDGRDGIQALHACRRLVVSTVTTTTYLPEQARLIAASDSVHASASTREHYAPAGHDAWTSRAEAQAHLRRRAQALLCRQRTWNGHGTLRSFHAGAAFRLQCEVGHPVVPALLLTHVTHAGVGDVGWAARVQPPPALIDGVPWQDATAHGYANHFQGQDHAQPWRPQEPPALQAPGPQRAVVLGDASGTPVHMDRLGRIRVRFAYSEAGHDSAWVRVAQRYAGPGVGSQFIPRVGQEVLVAFLEGDIDQPIVQGALYNGRGDQRPEALALARDGTACAEMNLAGGNAPVWHAAGAGAAGQRHQGALWGIRSQEWSGEGGNHLLFDDSNGQLRTELASSHHHSRLSQGHLLHQAGNHRGSLRGTGFELRSDAWGVVRATAGLWLDTARRSPHDPASQTTGAQALLQQAQYLADHWHAAAQQHRTVGLAAAQGAGHPGRSSISPDRSPLHGMRLHAASTAAGHDYATAPPAPSGAALAAGSLPLPSAPLLGLYSPVGIGNVAGQALLWSAAETTSLASGGHSASTVGGHLRWHGRQSIGMLAGVTGSGGTSALTLAAGQDVLDVQAQAGPIELAARRQVRLAAAQAPVQLHAGSHLHIATAEGASITLTDGNLQLNCPGTLTVQASQHSFVGPTTLLVPLPQFPQTICVECLIKAMQAGTPWAIKNG
ncbi:type VI secretion system Vgr family protein [Stenotrophomonas sp. 24(2023)]|uniref:type VI secretion system Vgr family protein n=1 Tax=Stenotrophomonas sp. 24(2023) TaxID=3068324 RepID=UPI0027DF9F39|nr:type VI secretion system Vgr family protein [Stenotrophomonas sp. 24(2023)]WMJ70216.1 type VI secretion system tip protein TssI/VgrG [Stenotrophomonas sp. 24(2023)]